VAFSFFTGHGQIQWPVCYPFCFYKQRVEELERRTCMSIDTPLFEGSLVCLGPIDHEKDPEVISRWSHDAGFMRMMYTDPMRPLAPWQVKKEMEKLEKSLEEARNLFHFRIRSRKDGRLLGFAELNYISWTNASGFIRLGIGASEDRRQGFGSDALGLLLYYAFVEVNLYRLTANIPDYNHPAQNLFKGFGFREEVRRRQALQRDCCTWDLLQLGLLADEWKERQK
jgi:RimJ/RimL family protein N-acetyltransferase